jgi:H/ACA ribonucleoprotein complex non-core subunit NAF1
VRPEDQDQDFGDDDDTGPLGASNAYLRTKNEHLVVDIPVPDFEEIGPDERLEKVGEVMIVMDNVVIVRGTSSEVANRGSEKALDAETLLVFEDRRVMGYVGSFYLSCLIG